MRAVRDFLAVFISFLKKRLLLINKYYRPGIQNLVSRLLQIGHKSEKWQWHHNFFWRFHVSLVNIFVYKGLTRNLEIGNTPVWVLPNIWRLGRVRDTKFGMNVSNKKSLNAATCQDYSFYRFWIIEGKPTGLLKIPCPTQISVKNTHEFHMPHCYTSSIFFQWNVNVCQLFCVSLKSSFKCIPPSLYEWVL